MRITHLTLRNWRTFKNMDIPVGQRLIVIGPNASGKSNLLDSIRFLRDLAAPGGGLQDAVRSRGGLSRVRCLFARNNHHGWVGITAIIGDDNGEKWTSRSPSRASATACIARSLRRRSLCAETRCCFGDRTRRTTPIQNV